MRERCTGALPGVLSTALLQETIGSLCDPLVQEFGTK